LRLTNEFDSLSKSLHFYSFLILKREKLSNNFITIFALIEQVIGLMVDFEVNLSDSELLNLPLKFMGISNVLNNVISGYIFVQRPKTFNYFIKA
jgi:hypothetical protein